MKVGTRAWLRTLAFVAMTLAGAALARGSKARHGAGDLTLLRVGQWIRMEGAVQKDQAVLCRNVRLLTGDFLDNDWSVRGVISGMSPGGRFRIGPYAIVASSNAVFEISGKNPARFSDMRVGMFVEAEGSYRKDGTFLADEIDEQDDVRNRHGSGRSVEVVAKVEAVHVARRQITAMGTVFQLTDKTQMKSILR